MKKKGGALKDNALPELPFLWLVGILCLFFLTGCLGGTLCLHPRKFRVCSTTGLFFYYLTNSVNAKAFVNSQR